MHYVTLQSAKRPKSAIRAALTLVGFSAVIGQIVLMRELIVVFNGNEISLGIMLATWLFWTALGSGLGSGLTLGTRNARKSAAVLECLLGVSLLPTIWALRASRTFFQTVPGELVGPVPMWLTSLICLSLFCALAGCLFVIASRMYAEECGLSARVASSSAYLLEAAGSGLGGLLASLVLLPVLDSFQIAAVVTVVNLCMAVILWFRVSGKKVAAVAVAGGLLALVLLMYVAPLLDRSARERLWRGFQLLGSRDSIYGNLAVIGTGNIRSIYDNGVILASAPDESAAEEAVHYGLLEHPAPKQVLLIGGGINGSITEALKHPTVGRIDYVELDPALIGMARQFFPVQSAGLSDPRVHTHYADGRYYLKSTPETFDVIILNLPDPQTAQLNRFYTAEFFRTAANHLASGGLLALQLRSSEEHISPDLAEFLRCIQHTVQQVFPYVVAIPGDTLHLFAAMRDEVLTDDPQTLIARLQARRLATKYVREYFIPFRMTPDRMAQIGEQLQPLPATPVNHDFEPIAYYFDIALWSAQFHASYSRWFRTASHLTFTGIVDWTLVVLLFVAVLLTYVPGREKRVRAAAAGCVAATGFTLMALQIFLLLGFQSIYGYVYHQLAILVGMLMAGIALGSWLGIRRIGAGDTQRFLRIAALTQFALAVSGPALIFVVILLSQISSGPATWLSTQCGFPALAILCGILGGYQFPIATEIYLGDREAGPGLGTLYAIDLLGGCVGALLLSSYLIPVFGFWKTAWLSAVVSLVPAVLAARESREPKASPA